MSSQMKQVGTKVDNLLSNVVWKRDLEWADGPLLSLFRDEVTSQPYLYHWVDCDSTSNRWLVASVSDAALARLLARKLPLRDALHSGAPLVFIVDIDGSGTTTDTYVANPGSLPPEYLPEPQCVICPSATAPPETGDVYYSILLDRHDQFGPEMHIELPRAFMHAYAMANACYVKPAYSGLKSPFKGGFSMKHYYDYLEKLLTSSKTYEIRRYQYASHGLLQLRVDLTTLSKVLAGLARYRTHEKEGAEIVRQIQKHNYEKQLNYDNVLPTADSLQYLAERGRLLEQILGDPTMTWLAEGGLDAFQATKVQIGYWNRLKKLDSLEKTELVTYTDIGSVQPVDD